MIIVAQSVDLSAHLTIDLTEDEKRAAKRAAKAAGLSASAWGRQAINAAVRGRPASPASPDPRSTPNGT